MRHSNAMRILTERRLPIFFLLVFTIIMLLPATRVLGDDTEDNQVNYSVQAVLPEENQNPDVSYFDLIVEPGEELELQLLIHNNGTEEIEIDVTAVDASTNRNGLIIYNADVEIDSSLEEPLSAMVTLDEERVTVPAGESKEVTAELIVPEDEFDGVKLGGFRFQEAPALEDEDDDSEQGIQIINEYVYTIGLMIRQNDDEVIPELDLLNINSDVENHRTAITVNIQNPTPTIIRNLEIVADVYDEENDELVLSTTLENASFAPNSNMNLFVNWDEQPLEKGDYRLELSVENDEDNWEWIEEFTVEDDE